MKKTLLAQISELSELPEGHPTLDVSFEDEAIMKLPIADWNESIELMDYLVNDLKKNSISIVRNDPDDIRSCVPQGASQYRTWRVSLENVRDIYVIYIIGDERHTVLRFVRDFSQFTPGSRVMFEHPVIGWDEASIIEWYRDMAKIFAAAVNGSQLGWRSLVDPDTLNQIMRENAGQDSDKSLPN